MNMVLRGNKGFTLVEILISLVILGIIVASFLALFGTGLNNIFSIGSKDLAMAEASDFMEILYREQTSENGLTDADIENLLIAAGINQNGSYTIEEIDHLIDSDEATKGYEVTITINYGNNQQVSLTSFIRGKN